MMFLPQTKLIKACSTQELSAVGLAPPTAPAVPLSISVNNSSSPLAERLRSVQATISSLHYNHASSYHYNVSKARPLPAILDTAAGILRDPLPIKCIEAVFLGLHLTQGWEGLQRIPVGFKSRAATGQVYRHIVLVVCDTAAARFGALGLSRRSNLMDKPLTFTSLSSMIQDYQAAYRDWGHELMKVRVGLPVEHGSSYAGPVCWRYCTVNPEKRSWVSLATMLDHHAAAAASLQERFKAAALAAATNAPSVKPNALSSSPGTAPAKSHHLKPHGIVAPPFHAPLEALANRSTALLSPRLARSVSSSPSNTPSNLSMGTTQPLSQAAVQQLADVSYMAPCSPLDLQDACSMSKSAAGLDIGNVIRIVAYDCGSDGGEEFDSDSEVNVIVDSIRLLPQRVLN
eukprot:GHRR01028106.1.p1 GENE.GHRR01028106.1~~GHRR01028106.1.p1  ORF type:complete len:401 (+),score=143.18 GHRR01028106.1:680-1882(+)